MTSRKKLTKGRRAKLLKKVADIDKSKRADWETRRSAQITQNIKIGDNVTDSVHATVLTVDEMIERFVFIGHAGAIVDRLNGRIRKKDIAAQEYAASLHVSTHKNGTKAESALKVWKSAPRRLTVDVLTWYPGQKEFCTPPDASDGAKTALNTWRGLKPIPAPKNWKKIAKPFLDHIAYLIPDRNERKRFLKWLAHIAQRPWELPHTSYLMITKTTGIGRNGLASILTRVFRGNVAAGVSLSELLDGGFNGRLSQKVLATVDELKDAGGEGRYRRQQKLSSLITEEFRYINPKYGVPSVEKNCCRWLMFSNFADALPFSNADRRIIVIANPVERRPASYYSKLYRLLDKEEFIGAVRKVLETIDIRDFNPGEHAPMNKAKENSLNTMMTEVESAVRSFKDECTTPLASMTEIRDYVTKSCDVPHTPQHLNHAITDAGMALTHRRVKHASTRHSVVIVNHDEWTVDSVRAAKNQKLIEVMGLHNPFKAAALSSYMRGVKP